MRGEAKPTFPSVFIRMVTNHQFTNIKTIPEGGKAMKTFKIILTAALIGVLFGAGSAVAFPGMFYYSGKLTDSGGNPIDGTVSITFRLYSVATGGTPSWTEAHGSVDVDNGSYTVMLGSITPNLDLEFDGSDKWLGITVDTDSEMTPRHKVLSVPYAMNADRLDGKHASGFLSATEGSQEISVSASDWVIRAVNNGSGIGLDAASTSGAAVRGQADGTGIGVHGVSIDGWGGYFQAVSGPGLAAEGGPGHVAAWLNGDVEVTGAISEGGTALSDKYVTLDADTMQEISGSTTDWCILRVENLGTAGGICAYAAGGGEGVTSYSSYGAAVNGVSSTGYGGYFSCYNGVGLAVEGSPAAWFEGDVEVRGGELKVDSNVVIDGVLKITNPSDSNDFLSISSGDTWTSLIRMTDGAAIGQGLMMSSNGLVSVEMLSSFLGITTETGGIRVKLGGLIVENGNVGFGRTTASYPLHMGSGAHCTAGGVWTNASSRKYKENIHELTCEEAVEALEGLNPVTFNYKVDKEEQHLGFIAEEVPELVSTKDREGMSPMDVVAVLTKVVQEQQKTIDELKKDIADLKKEVE